MHGDLPPRRSEREIWAEERQRTQRVYLLQAGHDGPIKVGWTTSVSGRVETLQQGNHKKLRVLATAQGDKVTECSIQRRLRDYHIRGDWFRRAALHEALAIFDYMNDVDADRAAAAAAVSSVFAPGGGSRG